jgi:hypothetical protein
LYLSDELEQIKEVADESWHLAIDDVKGRLLKVASSETKKSPLRRKIEKNGWWITITVVAFIMVFLKWYWLVEVTQPIETVEGVRQRTAALEKVLDYDDSMDTRVRRGGWLKGILFWPAEPTDDEVGYAGEILWWTLDVYDYLKKEGLICKASLSYNPNDDNIQDEIKIVKVLKDFIGISPSTADDGVELVAEAFVSKFPCE